MSTVHRIHAVVNCTEANRSKIHDFFISLGWTPIRDPRGNDGDLFRIEMPKEVQLKRWQSDTVKAVQSPLFEDPIFTYDSIEKPNL